MVCSHDFVTCGLKFTYNNNNNDDDDKSGFLLSHLSDSTLLALQDYYPGFSMAAIMAL